jgi:putative ABC transport system substrate-binding protein
MDSFRRCLLVAIACAPAASFAQQSSVLPRIGMLEASPGPSIAFKEAMGRLNYVEGRSIEYEARHGDGREQSLLPLARDLVARRVDVIVAMGNAAAEAAMEATAEIPIVFQHGDPVGSGRTKSLNWPGGNGTGVYVPTPELEAKRLELIKQILPTARRIGFLRNTSNPLAQRSLTEVELAARVNQVQLVRIDVSTSSELEQALERLPRQKLDAILISSDPMLSTNAEVIGKGARTARLPLSAPWKHYHRYGALTSYGPTRELMADATAAYVDRIVKGAKPNQLPVEELSVFELRVDLREASRLGIAIPQTVLLRADEVIR